MAQPIIGLTSGRHTSRDNVRIAGASEAYVQAVLQAGAIPLLIPLGLPAAAVDRLAAQMDGLLFTGGGDVEPSRYQSRPHPLVDSVDSDRDEIEIRLLRQAVERRLPFLGICRGLQVINVALGGSLYEDLLDQCPGALKHQHFDDHPRDYLAHPVQVTPESRLGQVLQQDSLAVNSLHHQGIRQLAPNLTATAWAPDGVIEAVEISALPFGVAVQWHPEWLPGDAGMRRLFAAFVEQAQTKH
ncbi:MAG TPA: gamma-glutamyl-gamma-aminobutyrate hydrolase family protein [Anaerolineales bacterium]|nr:gamma-glutamyl-gamma-aminobutyrate hydrolase family protein [Anaerolineales bacterium]